MKTNNFKFKTLVFLILAFSFAFLGTEKAAALSQFGEQCVRADNCAERLICSANTCVKCARQADCGPSETCSDGVCLAPNGNGEGDFCANDDQCVSKNCGENNLCQKASAEEKDGDGDGAGDGGPLSGFPGEDLEFGDITNIIVGLACWLTRVASTLAAIFVILAGFRFMMARDNPEKYQQAIKNFQTVLWGILVIYGVYVIIATVANAVGITDFSFIPLVC